MIRLQLSSAFFAVSLATACGKANGPQGEDGRYDAPALGGSSYTGIVFTAQFPDPSIPFGIVYQYDFSQGLIRTISRGESSEAAVFAAEDKVLLFNRLAGRLDFRIVTPGSYPSLTLALPLDIVAGDPFDVVPLIAEKSALIAEPLGGKLRILDYSTGLLTEFPTSQALSVDPIRPLALWRDDNQIATLHTGLEIKPDGTTASNNSQQIFRIKIDANGSLAYVDADPSTASIEGTPLKGSNPTGFLNRKNSTAKVLSLCNPSIKTCKSALENYTGTRISESQMWDGLFHYQFLGQIIDGPNDDQVFALVKSGKNQTVLVKIDLPSRGVEEIQTFSSERLYGISYDASARTLFVGGVKDGAGQLTIYRDLKKIAEISLDGVFYRSVLVHY